MEEVAPGIWHWASEHPGNKSSCTRTTFPASGSRSTRSRRRTSSTGWRSWGPDGRPAHEPAPLPLERRLRERFGATVRCARSGLHEFTHGEQVEPFDPGDELTRRDRRSRRRGDLPGRDGTAHSRGESARARRRSSSLGGRWATRLRAGQAHGRARANEGWPAHGIPAARRGAGLPSPPPRPWSAGARTGARRSPIRSLTGRSATWASASLATTRRALNGSLATGSPNA